MLGNNQTCHYLKTWPKYFQAVADGLKTFEIRSFRDRNFIVGDYLMLEEWDPQTEAYSGRKIQLEITYLLSDFGVEAGFVAIGFKIVCAWTADRNRRKKDEGATDNHDAGECHGDTRQEQDAQPTSDTSS